MVCWNNSHLFTEDTRSLLTKMEESRLEVQNFHWNIFSIYLSNYNYNYLSPLFTL